jgi:ribosomal protein L16 Arg81 hydroxylase
LKREILRLALTGAPADVMVEALCEQTGQSRNVVADEIASVLVHLERAAYFQASAERKAFWQMSVARHLRRSEPDSGIAEYPTLEPDVFFSRHYFANRPVVFRNLLAQWPMCANWTFDWLEKTYGKLDCEVMAGPDGRANVQGLEGTKRRRRMPFGDVVRQAQSKTGADLYLVAQNNALRTSLRPIAEALKPLPGVLNGETDGAHLWVGPKGTVTHLHHDMVNLLNVQVLGSKRFLFVPPSDTVFVYNNEGVYCEVNAADPDPVRHPLFKEAQVREAVLGEGDAVFIPVGWWHYVESLAPSVSLSFGNFVHNNAYPRTPNEQEGIPRSKPQKRPT